MKFRVMSAGVLVLTAITSMPAAAAENTHRDAKRDVVLQYSDDSDNTITKPRPLVRTGDIKLIRVTHSTSRLIVRVKFRAAPASATYGFDYRIDTSHHEFELVGGTAARPRGKWTLIDHTGKEVQCPGFRHRVNYSQNRVRVSIPRRCLSRPNKIRVGVLVETPAKVDGRYRFDWAYSKQAPDLFPYGPWLRHG